MKIKATLTILLTICLAQISCGQHKPNIVKSENSRLIKVLNNSELIEKNAENNLIVRIYKIDNGSGSAEIAESHQASDNLLIAVSEYDEYPLQNLFDIGPFFNPKFIKWTALREDDKEFEIEYGTSNNRKTIMLTVNINELKMK